MDDQTTSLNCDNNPLAEDLAKRMEWLLDSFTGIHQLDKQEFLEAIFKRVFALIPEADKGTFFELRGDYYYPIASVGFDKRVLAKLRFHRSETFFQSTQTSINDLKAHSLVTSDNRNRNLPNEMKSVLKELGTYQGKSILYAPIIVENAVQGMISLDNMARQPFSYSSHQILKYYAQLISEFYSHHLAQERLSQTYMDIVEALISAIELKDSYMVGHGHRVKEYSVRIAHAMQLPKRDAEQIRMAALLHDIGKIGIPETVLNKPGRLTQKEFELIKCHPTYSRQIIEKITGFADILELVDHRHENHDGSGYPAGVAFPQIPLGAQIIQVADAYDAMTSKRCYRDPMTKKQAIAVLVQESGRQFNPAVVTPAVTHVFSD